MIQGDIQISKINIILENNELKFLEKYKKVEYY